MCPGPQFSKLDLPTQIESLGLELNLNNVCPQGPCSLPWGTQYRITPGGTEEKFSPLQEQDLCYFGATFINW